MGPARSSPRPKAYRILDRLRYQVRASTKLAVRTVQGKTRRTWINVTADKQIKRVVIAEDEALIRMDLAEMLEEEGYAVVGQAGDGETAVKLAAEHRPDLVILDVKMPVLDGISAAERIGAEKIAPVLMLTAFSQRELVERARDAGAMAYLVKPFSKADLVPAIEMATSRYEQLRALENEVADLAQRFETRKLIDRAKGLLQTQLGLTEPEAFRWVQKTSMDRRLTMREVAQAVIDGASGGSPTAS
jgi:AmiR/NasT family two-component response regulator